MIKLNRDITKSERPRATATGEPVLVRVQPDLAKFLDDWRRKQEDLPGRPEAIRRLVELGLTVKVTRKKSAIQRRRANEMAASQIDNMTDKAAAEGDQASRKRRLLKGPEEFQNVRQDRKKATV
jgi:hypothetical protein